MEGDGEGMFSLSWRMLPKVLFLLLSEYLSITDIMPQFGVSIEGIWYH